jgi:L-amino acid N-acyltransferase YncA
MKVDSLAENPFEIRPLTADDWDSVRSIYAAGIASGQATFETEAPTWERWHGNHLPAPRLVAVANESILGWAALTPVSARPVYAGVAEVSVYVAREWQGWGIGRGLLDALVTESEQKGIWTLQASIFPENVASVSLHLACGFREVGRRERIAKMIGLWRDTLLLERRSKLVGND